MKKSISDEKMILMESPEAASIQTVTGWVGADGHFWGENERQARYGGCTHKRCEDCGHIYRKNTWCAPCHAEKARALFAAMPIVEWDETTPLVIFGTDTYFFDEDDVINHAEQNDVEVSDLKLVLCVPHHPRALDANDLFCDYLPEDMGVEDVSGEVVQAVAKLNEALKASQPFSWVQGKTRVRLGLSTHVSETAETP